VSNDESLRRRKPFDIRTPNFDTRTMESSDQIKAQLMSARDLSRTLDRMARQIVELIAPEADASAEFALIGMQTDRKSVV